MTTTNPLSPAPGAPLEPDTDASSTPTDDAVANSDLYKHFLQREGASTSTPTSQSTDEGSDTGSTEGEGEAPPLSEVDPGQTSTTTDTPPDEGDTDEEGEGEDGEGVEAPSDSESLTFLNRTFTRPEAETALRIVDWAQQLDPESTQAIDAVLSGDYVLVPRAQYEAGNQANQSPRSADTSGLPAGEDDDDYSTDPRIRARLDELDRRLSDTSSTQAAQLEAEQRARHEQVIGQITTGATRFATTHELADADSEALQRRVVELQILPGYMGAANGDAATAMERAMDAVYWADPKYRNLEMQKEVAKEQAINQASKAKARRASALTSNGGTAPRGEPAPATKDERSRAMANAIAGAMNGGQPS